MDVIIEGEKVEFSIRQESSRARLLNNLVFRAYIRFGQEYRGLWSLPTVSSVKLDNTM